MIIPIIIFLYSAYTLKLDPPEETCAKVSKNLKIAMLISFVAFVVVLVWLKTKLGGKVVFHETWGCGYDRLNSHIQYTASSYASPFLAMLRPLFKKVTNVEKPKRLFPKKAHLSTHFDDIEEAYVINPLVKFDEWFLSKFEKLQSGNLQSYIKYGLLFLVLILVGCLIIK